jgi:hypothetical protein
MGRYVFTESDLGPLGALLATPLVKDALAAAVPIKRFADPAVHRLQAIEVAVPVASRANPDGVPLHTLLDEVKKDVPTATGLVVRGGKVVATVEGRPSGADQKRLMALMRDRKRLEALQPSPDRDGVDTRELERKLRDDATPDDEWNKAFRAFAVQRLLEGERPR